MLLKLTAVDIPMKKILLLLLTLYLFSNQAFAQKTLMVEKVGSSRKYFYHTGDYLKLRISKQDTLLQGKLWSIRDSVISVAELRPFDVRLCDINALYKRFAFPRKFGIYMCIGSGVFFGIITVNHLINNEQVFTPDMFILSGSMLGAGLISIGLSEKKCRTGRWKIKVLNINVKK
jgi:hypothetical protein